MRITDEQYARMEEAMSTAGAEAGRNAAAWWEQDAIGGRANGDVKATARAVMKGIDDGDPEILDAMPTLDLSGQWADGLRPWDIYHEVSGQDWPSFDDAGAAAEDLVDTYRDAYDSAAIDAVYEHCQRVASND